MSVVFVSMKTGLPIDNYQISNLRKIHSVAFEFLDADGETNEATNQHTRNFFCHHSSRRRQDGRRPSTAPKQSRVVTGLLTGHNTPRRHLYLLGLLEREWGVREVTSPHILCKCEALASLKHAYLGSFFLEPEDVKSLGLGVIWNYSKVTGLP
jgi:hypothetical protein